MADNPLNLDDSSTASVSVGAADRPRICVLGSFNMDLVVRSPRYPTRGENLVGTAFGSFPGGKGANQAVGAARLGAEVTMIGAVGDDPYGRQVLELLGAEGIQSRHVATRAGVPTGVGLIIIDEAPGAGAQNTIIVALGANLALTASDVEAARPAIAAADVLLMQLETPLETVARGASIAREVGATVILNAAPAGPVPAEILADTDVLIVNEREAAGLLGPVRLDDPRELARQLSALGPECVVVTLGERGAIGSFKGEPVCVPAFPVEPVDTVGAGDAFGAALATRWAEQQVRGGVDAIGVLDAMCWGCAAGALAVTRQGAIPSLPTRAEVAALLRQAK